MSSAKVFLVTVSPGRFLTGCGSTAAEYPEAKAFPSEAAAVKFADKHVGDTGHPVRFEVWEHEAYAAGGEPCYVGYDLSRCSPMEISR